MRVRVYDLCGWQAWSVEHGQQLHDLIEPAIARGEEVVLDFEGVREFYPGFFALAVGPLVLKDTEDHLGKQLRYDPCRRRHPRRPAYERSKVKSGRPRNRCNRYGRCKR